MELSIFRVVDFYKVKNIYLSLRSFFEEDASGFYVLNKYSTIMKNTKDKK